ncbi:MAG: transposase [Gammaproteobacteria bacterium]
MEQTRTLRLRIRDKHGALLTRMARDVNFVWNYCNDLTYRMWRDRKQWPSGFDVQKYLKGSSEFFQLIVRASNKLRKSTPQDVGNSKSKLCWRASKGSKRSLGWIPFKKGAATYKNGCIKYAGQYFRVWDSYGLSQFEFRAGNFSQDARGRWYFNVVVKINIEASTGTKAIGIDLGLKDVAVTSMGERLENRRHYKELEEKLKIAQRANKSTRVKAIHAKIRNRRKDALHKFSTKLIQENAIIFVGNVKSQPLTQTKMAKSVLDAGWHMLKTMLEYKCAGAGVVFQEIDEKYTTQTCSSCGDRPPERPKGIAGLGIREWTCGSCGELHDRDINAAKNILALGHQRLAGGIHSL